MATATAKKATPKASIKTFSIGSVVENVRIFAFPWKQPVYILDNVIESISWTESGDRASVEADITVHNIDGFAAVALAPGTWLTIQYLDPTSGSWKNLDPLLYIWESDLGDAYDRTATVTAFDIISFLNHEGTQDWRFGKDPLHKKGWTAYQIAKKIMFDLEIKNNIIKTKYQIPRLVMQAHNPYEAVLKAYTRDRQVSNIRYRMRASGRTVIIKPYLNQDSVWEISEGSNLISARRVDNLDDLRTEMVVLSAFGPVGDDNKTGAARGYRIVSAKIARYGRIREVVRFDRNVRPEVLKNVAKILLKEYNKLKTEVTVEAEGILPLRAGDVVFAKESYARVSGRYFVHSIRHSFSSDGHAMSLTLKANEIVPTNFPTKAELVVPTVPKVVTGADQTAPGFAYSQSTVPTTGEDTGGLRSFARRLALAYKIDPTLFERQINQESGFDENAVSSSGAKGVAQIMPSHTDILPWIGKDPKKELNWAAYTMAKYLVNYNRRWDLALSAYNAGPGNVVNNKIPDIPQTIHYVETITGTLGPTKQTVGPAPNAGGALKYPASIIREQIQGP